MTPGNPLEWPKLSEDLPRDGGPSECQSCGARTTGHRWREFDHMERPTTVVIVLCEHCSNRLIGPHPRAYDRLQRHEPAPGTMPCCEDCAFRDGVRCRHRDLRENGGAGLILRFPEPTVGFVDYRGKDGRRMGSRLVAYRGPVSCDGQDFGGEA